MFITVEGLFEKIINKELTTSHLEKKVDIKVVPVAKLNKKMKESINKAQGAQFLKDAEYIIGCVEIPEMPQTPAEKEEQKEKNKEERAGGAEDNADTTDNNTAEEKPDNTDDTSTENTSADAGDSNDDTTEPEFGNDADQSADDSQNDAGDTDADQTEDDEDDEKKEKDVNESVTVQDLTSKMLVSIKPAKTSTPKTSSAAPAKKCEGEKKLPKKSIEEAETEATGDVLRGKFQKALTRIFGDQDETNKIELYDVRDVAPEGTNVYFAVISFKQKNAEEENK